MTSSPEHAPTTAAGGPLVTGLAWVAVVSHDPERVCRALGELLGLVRLDAPGGGSERLPLYAIGASRVVVATPGDPFVDGDTTTGVHHIALEAEHPEAVLARLDEAGLDVERGPVPAHGLDGEGTPVPGSAIALPRETTSGIRTRLVRRWPGTPPSQCRSRCRAN